jgi:NADH-quinone oxidoreductase subunit G
MFRLTEMGSVPKGTRLIEACMKSGHFIPHYCYHPKLSHREIAECARGAGNAENDAGTEAGAQPTVARDCRVRPAIFARRKSATDGVRTSSPLVGECRKGVMEFVLINHPLDCPICDQAGECRLQEFSVQYGKGESRFVEEKVKKPKRVDIGRHIVLDDERCIMCSRCVRFMQEIAKDDVLGFVNRGSHTASPSIRADRWIAITR